MPFVPCSLSLDICYVGTCDLLCVMCYVRVLRWSLFCVRLFVSLVVVICLLLCVVCRSLIDVRWLMRFVCCLFFVGCVFALLFVVCCWCFVVVWLLVVGHWLSCVDCSC